MAEHYVYKYVKDGEVIYVGKTDSNLKSRIDSHKTEPKFHSYEPCNVLYCELANEAQTAGVERLLIDLYQPILNIQYKHDRCCACIDDTFNWKPYSEYVKEQEIFKGFTRRSLRSSIANIRRKQTQNQKCLEFVQDQLDTLDECYEVLLSNVDMMHCDCILQSKHALLDVRFEYGVPDDRGHKDYAFVFQNSQLVHGSATWNNHYVPSIENCSETRLELFLKDYHRQRNHWKLLVEDVRLENSQLEEELNSYLKIMNKKFEEE